MASRSASGTTEVELKIDMMPADEARLRRHPALGRLRTVPRRTVTLVSVYYDTPGHALACAGIALRLRKVGRSWVQTIKSGDDCRAGLFARSEIETPAPGGRLALEGPDPEGMNERIREIRNGAALSPVFETRVRRIIEHLRLPDDSEIELALDRGEIVAGARKSAIHEAELELVSGEVAALYDLARMLFPGGPVRFSSDSKARRGFALARGDAPPEPEPRRAGTLVFGSETAIESVARDVFRDCHAQIASNMALMAESEASEVPHQLRIGLRRLRTAFAVFSGPLGHDALAPLSTQARDLGRVVGSLRDVDVLTGEVMAASGSSGLDAAAVGALAAALEERRTTVRAEVREALVAPGTVGFLFDLARLIEGRGWLSPSDYSQTERLAAPIGGLAPALLDKRHRKVMRRGRGIRKLSATELHALRKELKKFRYTADVLGVIWPGKKVAGYLKTLKRLQDQFGTLNDAAMVGEYLTGSGAPGRNDPDAQRAAGWLLGTLAVRAREDCPALFDSWDTFASRKPFWR